MTLYRGFDIGTAKPPAEDLAEIPHHLINKLDPNEDANAGWWLDLARGTLESLLSRGRRVILVGGTALYFQLLFRGMAEALPKSDEIRQRLEGEAIESGLSRLHTRLSRHDPQAAARIHPNDSRRIVRALEVFELTGQTISQFQTQWSSASDANEMVPIGQEKWIWLNWPRQQLRHRIAQRTREMISAGWLEEVRQLQQRFGNWGKTAGQAVGYLLLRQVIGGEMSLQEAERKITEGTCQVAKRQETWFRAMKMLTPIHCPGDNA
jgi:tRNA dimethylallyltransferase